MEIITIETPALGDRSYFHKHFDRRKDERRRKAAEAQIRREQAQNARRKT